jgi:hypothetical protein
LTRCLAPLQRKLWFCLDCDKAVGSSKHAEASHSSVMAPCGSWEAFKNILIYFGREEAFEFEEAQMGIRAEIARTDYFA